MRVAVFGSDADVIRPIIANLADTLPHFADVCFVDYSLVEPCLSLYKPTHCVVTDDHKKASLIKNAMANSGGLIYNQDNYAEIDASPESTPIPIESKVEFRGLCATARLDKVLRQ